MSNFSIVYNTYIIQWVPGKIVHNLFGSSITYKSFWLFQCIWHPSRVIYQWCIVNWSHWNHWIWSQDPKEYNRISDFFSFKSLYTKTYTDGSHMHWNKQKDLKVMLEPKRLCTILSSPHCISFGELGVGDGGLKGQLWSFLRFSMRF